MIVFGDTLLPCLQVCLQQPDQGYPRGNSRLSVLSYLNLAANAISELPKLTSLVSLRHLYLNDNKLTTMPKGAVVGLQWLMLLNLAFNHMKGCISDILIPNGTWDSLRIFNVSHNPQLKLCRKWPGLPLEVRNCPPTVHYAVCIQERPGQTVRFNDSAWRRSA